MDRHEATPAHLKEILEPPGNPAREPDPPLGSWRRMYVLVLGFLAFLVVLFTAFTKIFE